MRKFISYILLLCLLVGCSSAEEQLPVNDSMDSGYNNQIEDLESVTVETEAVTEQVTDDADVDMFNTEEQSEKNSNNFAVYKYLAANGESKPIDMETHGDLEFLHDAYIAQTGYDVCSDVKENELAMFNDNVETRNQKMIFENDEVKFFEVYNETGDTISDLYVIDKRGGVNSPIIHVSGFNYSSESIRYMDDYTVARTVYKNGILFVFYETDDMEYSPYTFLLICDINTHSFYKTVDATISPNNKYIIFNSGKGSYGMPDRISVFSVDDDMFYTMDFPSVLGTLLMIDNCGVSYYTSHMGLELYGCIDVNNSQYIVCDNDDFHQVIYINRSSGNLYSLDQFGIQRLNEDGLEYVFEFMNFDRNAKVIKYETSYDEADSLVEGDTIYNMIIKTIPFNLVTIKGDTKEITVNLDEYEINK